MSIYSALSAFFAIFFSSFWIVSGFQQLISELYVHLFLVERANRFIDFVSFLLQFEFKKCILENIYIILLLIKNVL